MVEAQNNLAQSSPVQREYILKSVQITATTTLIENTIAYYIGESPATQMLISATEKLLDGWKEDRLEPLLDNKSLKLRQKISTQFGNKNNRKTGDTNDMKLYPGGSLRFVTARSAPSMRTFSIQILYIDEADAAPKNISTGEGNYVGIASGRQTTFGDRKKMAVMSTPAVMETSIIWPLYCSGDQRHYYWPCPHCGSEWTPAVVDTENETVTWDQFKVKKNEFGHITKAWFECPHCNEEIFNHHKSFMIPRGRWKEHAVSCDEFTVSRYIPSFLSPIGMLTWLEIARKYEEALEDPDLMITFHNLYLGFPWKESGQRPSMDQLNELRSGYTSGMIPPGVLFLTLAVDVQRGSKTEKKPDGTLKNPERLEVEIEGFGIGLRKWHIKHIVIEGNTKNENGGAWQELYEMFANGEFVFTRADGMVFEPRINGVDSGDGARIAVVYAFCDRLINTYPLKGFGGDGLTRRDGERKEDKITRHNWLRYALRKQQGGTMLLQISTNYYKAQLYKNLKQTRNQDGTLPTGFCSYPKDISDAYFKQLTAEDQRVDGTFAPTKKRNEALDLNAYCQCLADLYLDQLVDIERDFCKKKNIEQDVNKLTILKRLESQVSPIT